MRRISLAPLTVPGLSPPEFISCAAQAGYSEVALRLIQGNLADPTTLLNDGPLLRETCARLRNEGIAVAQIEVLVLDAQIHIEDYAATLQTSAELGASDLVVGVSDPDFARACDNFAELCRRAAPFNLTVTVEFVPYTAIRTLDRACELVGVAGSINAGVLIDAIHFDRAGQGVEDLARYPGSVFSCVQLCDAPAARPADMQEIMRQSRQERLYPGEGGIDLQGMLRALPSHLPISVEVPHIARIQEFGEIAHARRARELVIALLHRLDER